MFYLFLLNFQVVGKINKSYQIPKKAMPEQN